MRNTSLALITVLSVVLSVSAASAKDVCLQDTFGNFYVLRKVKKLKPAGAIGLSGIAILGTNGAFPFDGSASMNTAGTVARFGMFVHSGSNSTAEWTGDATFAGSGTYDVDGSYMPGGPITFTVIDCTTVIVP